MNISIKPEVMSGTPCFTGTRVPVGVLFENLADGSTLDEILEDWPTITRDRAIAMLQEARALLEREARRNHGVPNPPPDPRTSAVPSNSIGFLKMSWWLPRTKRREQ